MERFLLIVRLAGRNLRRQLRRSLLTASAVVLGVGLLMFVRAWEAGAHVMYVESATRMGTGHVAMEHPAFMGSRELEDRIPASTLARIREAVAGAADPGDLLAVLPRITVGGLGQSASSSIPLQVSGVDPGAEAPVSFFVDKVEAGRYLEPDDRLEAVVGAGVADRLRLELGSRLVLMVQGVDGELESQLVRVEGIFRTGIPEVDRGVVHLPLATAQGWLGMEEDVTSVNVVLASDRHTEPVARAVRSALVEDGVGEDQVAVRPWWEAMPDLHAGLRADAVQTYIMLLVLLGIVGLAVVNSVLMAVLYRTREFGVLRALGLNRRSVVGMVMVEGTLLTLVSGILGMGLGLLISLGVFRNGLDISVLLSEGDLAFGGAVIDPVIFPVVQRVDVLAIFAIVVTIGILASIYPAWQASRIAPDEAMKSEN